MTTWGSRSTGSPTTSVSGISATRARIRSTSACWRALTSSRSATTAWSAAAAPSAAGTFSKPADPLVDPVVDGERGAPPDALADQQHADPGRSAPLVRRARGHRPAVRERQPAHRGAGVHEERVPRRGSPRRPAGRCPTSWLADWSATTSGSPSVGEVDAARRSTRRPAGDLHGRAARPARAGRRSARRRRATTVGPPAPRQPEQAPVHGVGAGRGERHLVAAYAERLGDRLPGVVEDQPGVAGGAVQPAGVGVPLVERGEHRLTRRGMQRLGGRGVDVHARKLPVRGNPPGRFSTLRLG